jgi:1-acyl-sn-glycerol-3-phosphate acyltransferase
MLAVWVILVFFGLLAWAFFCHRLLQNPRGDFAAGMIWHSMRLYSRAVHRLRVEGLEHIPRDRYPGPLILVCNHTAGIDPILVQSVCPFEVRFVMAKDMRHPLLEWFWQIADVIFVDRESGDAMGARRRSSTYAGRRAGNLSRRRAGTPGAHDSALSGRCGAHHQRTEAPVLPVVVSGTPIADQAWTSLVRFSRSVVTFHAPINYTKADGAEHIADDLRARYAEWTGWPMSEGS